MSLDALQSRAQKLQLLADGQTLSLASVALDNARLQVRQGAAGAQLQAETPALRLGGIAARRGTERAELAELSLQGSRIEGRSAADGATELAFTGMQAAGKQLALARAADTVQLASMALGSEVLKLTLGREAARFSGSGTTAALTDIRAMQAGNRLALQDARWKPADVFPVTVARVKVSGGQMEFADLSLRPQFGTRMHELKGVITGLSTDPERVAKVQLDARVDKFGSARIRGQASVLQPDKLTEIEMAFRNLEMTSLSPYVVKFAGYEIASGKLSLDLQYKVRDSKLLGENKVVLNQMALGKKVESPDALDLPLDLALAVLKDSKGVIDIGLPVSGDLNDPKFDYGAVIAKAIGNVLGGIVTAPFRALAALFGGGSDAAIDTIDFEPGSAELAPPEQQKVETVARALLARPQLRLKVAPVFAADRDTPVLQSRTVRSEVARGMGLSLVPSEDPGPIDAANPRAAAAIEAAFSARYAPAVLDLLKQRARVEEPTGAAPDPAVAPQVPASASAGAAVPAAAPVVIAGGTPPGKPAVATAPALEAGFHQRLLDRMIAEQVVSAQDLDALANRRADGIVQRLTVTDGVPAERVALAKAREVADATDKVVPLKLELEAAR